MENKKIVVEEKKTVEKFMEKYEHHKVLTSKGEFLSLYEGDRCPFCGEFMDGRWTCPGCGAT